jgi:hypothetical protein
MLSKVGLAEMELEPHERKRRDLYKTVETVIVGDSSHSTAEKTAERGQSMEGFAS